MGWLRGANGGVGGIALSGKGGTGMAKGLIVSSKTPRVTYTSHSISIKHHFSSPPLHTNLPPTLSPRLKYPSHNEGFRSPNAYQAESIVRERAMGSG
jgi:hypothetical protein